MECPLKIYHEGEISFLAPDLEHFKHAPKVYQPTKAPIFYNPRMELNRDFTMLMLKSYMDFRGKENLFFSEPLASIGVRSIRVLKELSGFTVSANDRNLKAVEMIRLNAELNDVKENLMISHDDANAFLSGHVAEKIQPDTIDIDPFGTPVPFIDSACRVIFKSSGLLAVTATDMPPLCGIKKDACVRKYGARPLNTKYCHEIAVRIMIGHVVKEAARHEFSLKPILAWSRQHYLRVFFLTKPGKKNVDESLDALGYIFHCFKCGNRKVTAGFFPDSDPIMDWQNLRPGMARIDAKKSYKNAIGQEKRNHENSREGAGRDERTSHLP
ncbi:MAG: hypothetical protein ACTSSI_14045 [Candidatus Helarchaeota archaeon]